MPFDMEPPPPQRRGEDWAFVEELRTAPYHCPVRWTPRPARRGEVSLATGASLAGEFDDPRGLLRTAFEDFAAFLASVGLRGDGAFSIVPRRAPASVPEAFRIAVTGTECEIAAGDVEGVRRGLVWVEDEMLRRGGPFLPQGVFRRDPAVRTRLSRCFYGPVNRPPKCRDELADDVDYYPEAYLNRLAHEGVNGLWLTLHFFQTVPSRIIPQYGRDAGPRLDKLRRTVAKCEQYGIRIYPFCIEPAGFNWPYPEVAAAAAAHPDLRGHNGAFCVSTPKGQAYLEEATRTLFSEVPGLGGLVVIPVGERRTHCCSGGLPADGCPRCAPRAAWDVLSDALSGLLRGMRVASPTAELIAWPYGQFVCWGEELTAEAARHMPQGVVLQHNFETGGSNRQLGKERRAWDYWLSYAGPSALFRRCAQAVPAGVRMSAKLQVACSHEVATTQFVPVPGILYDKYRQMRELGVSSAMQCWYFGAFPSLMGRAAGELAFDPLPRRRGDFLLSLARRDWGRFAPQVAKAWQRFQAGYSQYPTAHIFGYFGPMHDGPVWPLFLEPRRLPLAPTWQVGYPPSGDYIAECVTNGFTLRELLTLCERMAKRWAEGVALLTPLRGEVGGHPERMREIRVAEALGLQFRSGANILRFYALRERLADARGAQARLRLLEEMRDIVQDEKGISGTLLRLCEEDSLLGFHSEAEGYKYDPERLRWRMRQLDRLLATEFPDAERRAGDKAPLFPEYTGEAAVGLGYACKRIADPPAAGWGALFDAAWGSLPPAECGHGLRHVYNRERWKKCAYDPLDHLPWGEAERGGRRAEWRACHDGCALWVGVHCFGGGRTGGDAFAGEEVEMHIEPERTRPRIIFRINAQGEARCVMDDGYLPQPDAPWQAGASSCADGWRAWMAVPFEWLGGPAPRKPVRANVLWNVPAPDDQGQLSLSWAQRQPVKGRLVWRCLNPATDFGWLRFGR